MRACQTGGKGGGGRRRGAVALEFAILVVLFLIILFGIIEFGRVMMVLQIMTNAAREGARRAVVPGATDAHVQQIIDGYMNSARIAGHTRTIRLNGVEGSLSSAASHDSVAVTVSVPYARISWLSGVSFIRLPDPDTVLATTVVMRKE